jgi:hypothetical protein
LSGLGIGQAAALHTNHIHINMKAPKTIAIVASTPALGEAMKGLLQSRVRKAQFKIVSKIADAPLGAELCTLGIPSYVPGSDPVTIHSFGSRIIPAGPQATEQRRLQWQVLRSPESTYEDVIAELGTPEEYLVLPSRALAALTVKLAKLTVQIASADDAEEELEAYKEGFEMLRDALYPKPQVIPMASEADDGPDF